MTAKAFAAREGVNARTLSWWASTLRDEGATPTKFIDVSDLVTQREAVLEVVVREAVAIRVRRGFDASLLREVVAALEAR